MKSNLLRINKTKLNIFLSTLNFVLCFIGFQLVTSLFLPAVSDINGVTLKVTVPYRAFALLISLLVIIMNFHNFKRTFPLALHAFLLYWGLLIIRMLYDVFIRTDVHLSDTSQLWFYVFLICIPSFLSIIASYRMINLEKTFLWIVISVALTMILTLFTNQALMVGSDEISGRQGGNAAISTIAFGHFGTTSIILGLFTLLKKDIKAIVKILCIFLIIIGVFCMLRAGSRGPVMALIVVIFFWSFSRQKKLWLSIVNLAIIAGLTIIFIDYILTLTGSISPIIEARLRVTIYEGSTGGRDPYYSSAFNAFLDSPIWGKQFALFFPDRTFDYSHNMVLDALMGMGVIGAGLLLYFLFISIKKSYFYIKHNDPYFWIFLLLIQQITFNMLSSSFYFNPLLSVLLVFVFLRFRNYEPVIHK